MKRPIELVAVTLLFGAASAVGAACSDDEPAPPASAPADGGTQDGQRPPPAADETGAPTCRDLCDQAHPNGRTKDQPLVACWEQSCRKACLEGQVTDAGATDAGACVSDVVTPSASCDQCTRASCCPAWDGCFEDPDCVLLNRCYQNCE